MTQGDAVQETVEQELKLRRIRYGALNPRQKENYNFQKISGLLADYGYHTMRLSDDWQGADFIAMHIDGERFLRVQLKGRPWIDTKYKGRDIWICFRDGEDWYLYPHDAALRWALEHTTVSETKGWTGEEFDTVSGAYSWSKLGGDLRKWLIQYQVPGRPASVDRGHGAVTVQPGSSTRSRSS